MKTEIKKYGFDEIKDEFLGKKGTPKRDQFEYELNMEILGELIKKTRKERNLSQEELGKLVGVQKAQISRLENHTGNVTLATVLKVFKALKAKVKMQVEIDDSQVVIA
jgi:HTH-type transcriptional regulator / antitoxin HipB